MALKDGSPEDYHDSAIRHLADAKALKAEARLDNAGHLVGFAAECAIKFRIEALSGGEESPQQHLPFILAAARKRLGGRVGYASMYSIIKADIFTDWSVDHRYSANGKVTVNQLDGWISIAHRLFAAANIRMRQA